MTARIGTGTTITFGTSGFTAEIVGISIDVTHLATPVAGAGEVGSREKIPGKHVDPGQLKLTCHYDPDTDPPSRARRRRSLSPTRSRRGSSRRPPSRATRSSSTSASRSRSKTR